MTYHCDSLHSLLRNGGNDEGGLMRGHWVNQTRCLLTDEDVIETSLIAPYKHEIHKYIHTYIHET